MKLLDIEGKITPENDKTNIGHSFYVPNGVDRLIIEYSYSPKTVSGRKQAIKLIKDCFEKYDEPLVGRPNEYLPVNNLVTLSLDCNDRYIGAAHRPDSTQIHIISARLSSPGFIRTEIEEGYWRVCLNLHSVNCDVKYSLCVEGVER